MQKLIDEYASGVNSDGKPFPLLYEEIFSHCSDSDEKVLLHEVANITKTITYSDLHNEVWKKYQTVLTTNYDYALEGGNRKGWKKHTKETEFSLYRKYTNGNHTVWHIHGDMDCISSICLGFERYIGTAQRLRGYILNAETHKDFRTYKIREKLERFASGETDLVKSWADHFFLSDMDILGLGLDTSEIDLWWLLTYRKRLIKKNVNPHQNTIRYFYWKKDMLDKKRDLFELLKAVKVDLESIEAADWESFYHKVLEKSV